MGQSAEAVIKSNERGGVSLWNKLRPRARRMRQAPTAAERLLWEKLRGRRLEGFKFRRQHAIDRFIVDFYCPRTGLVIEVDGRIHRGRKEEDVARDAHLRSMGMRVVRFDNQAVLDRTDSVIESISSELRRIRAENGELPHPPDGTTD